MPIQRLPVTPLRGGSACWARIRFFSPAQTNTGRRSSGRHWPLVKLLSSMPTRSPRNSANCGSGWVSRTTTSSAPQKTGIRSGCRNCFAAFATTVTSTKALTPDSIASPTSSMLIVRNRALPVRTADGRPRPYRKRIISSSCRRFRINCSNFMPIQSSSVPRHGAMK